MTGSALDRAGEVADAFAGAVAWVRRIAPRWGWVFLCLCASVALVFVAAHDIANHRYVSGDEPWIMSASYNLAFHGRFGSDIWAGFYGADDHWFISLPVVNFAQALIFRVVGAGIAEARLVSLIAGVSLLWLVGWFAARAFGLGAAALALAFLLLARTGDGFSTLGIPLIALARTARYDMLAVTLFWVVVVLLYRWSLPVSPARAACIGIVCGLATLTQFFGIAAPLLVAAYWMTGPRAAGKRRALALAGIAFSATVALYVLYVFLNWQDFLGQLTLKSGRYGFDEPRFFVANLRDEYLRYRWLADPLTHRSDWRVAAVRSINGCVLAIGAAIAAWATWRGKSGARGPAVRLLWLSLAVPALVLTLGDVEKVFLYAIVVLPSLVVVAALGWVRVARGLPALARRPLRGFGVTFVLVALTVLIAGSGISAWWDDRAFARNTNRYTDVGAEIERHLTPEATVIGPDRWWWALRDHEYYSLLGMLSGLHDHDALLDATPFAERVRAAGADYMILNDGNEGWLAVSRPDLDQAFWEWISLCTTRIAAWIDPKYGPIRIHRVEPDRDGPVCDAASALRPAAPHGDIPLAQRQ